MNVFKTLFVAAALACAAGVSAAPGDDHRHDDNNHAGMEHHGHFHRGEKLTEHYRDNRYVVNDYREHHLRKPPRGYHWVRDDDNNDFVLAAVATGLISQIIANQQH